jgi:protein-S-isoprenylcysteine O-methyltransferase Ste14
MQLIPAFGIGIWNAWIFTAIFLIVPLLGWVINKEAYKKLGTLPDMKLSKREKVIGNIANIITAIAFLYAIFLPFKLGTAWFYIGLFIFLLAVALLITAVISVIATPIDSPVTEGIYRYSRHPLYFSCLLALIAIGIATASWIILLAGILFFILVNFITGSEERYCKEKYGDTYIKYLKKVPRWIGIPKS